MPFILDASVTLAWCFQDEAQPYADQVLTLIEHDSARVPSIWPLEVANALCAAERRRRLTALDTIRVAEILRGLPISIAEVSLATAIGPVLELARAQQLSAYDAAYLDLAMREGLSLATLDTRLSEAAARLGVPLVA